MVPPNRGLASAGHKASGSLLAMSEDECKPDGLGRVQTSMQADAVTCHKFLHFPWRYGSLFCSPAIIRALFPKSHAAVEANRFPFLLPWTMSVFFLSPPPVVSPFLSARDCAFCEVANYQVLYGDSRLANDWQCQHQDVHIKEIRF